MGIEPCLFFRQEKNILEATSNHYVSKSMEFSWSPIRKMKIAEFEEVKRIKVSERSRLFLY